MKKTKAFSLIEVVFALFILSLIIVIFMPALGSIEKSNKILKKKDHLYLQAQNAMEKELAHQKCQDCSLVVVRTSTYTDSLEKVEVLDGRSEEILLYALRKK